MKELYIDISLTQCVLKEIFSDLKAKFVKLEDYIEELRKSNDGSTVILETKKDEPDRFRRIMYILLL